MGIKDFFQGLFWGGKTKKEDAAVDKEYSSQNTFPSREIAVKEFERAKNKLFDVNGWSDLSGLTSKFELHDHSGHRIVENKKPEVGDFIRIMLPGPAPENWVQVIDVQVSDKAAEFTVSPSEDPTDKDDDIEHFFVKEATSTFRVNLEGQSLYAYEIGKNEAANNQGEEAGNREIINTLISAGGWIAFQELQWKKLTAYLVHKEEIEEKGKA